MSLPRHVWLGYLAGLGLGCVPAVAKRLLQSTQLLPAPTRATLEHWQGESLTAWVAEVADQLRAVPDTGWRPAELPTVATRLCFQRWRFLAHELTDDYTERAAPPRLQEVRTLLQGLHFSEVVERMRTWEERQA